MILNSCFKVHTEALQDHLTEWLKYRETFLDEVLRHDGLGDFLGRTRCSRCQNTEGILRCKDCARGSMLKCAECFLELHQSLPLHRVEVSARRYSSPDGEFTRCYQQRWNGEFFVKDTLQNLGLRYQLGHSTGSCCPFPQAGPKNFTVFDITGPHRITIDYCHCDNELLPNYQQLLREKWFPATFVRPQTVFTFDCLETFHELTLQGKTNLYDYYHSLL